MPVAIGLPVFLIHSKFTEDELRILHRADKIGLLVKVREEKGRLRHMVDLFAAADKGAAAVEHQHDDLVAQKRRIDIAAGFEVIAIELDAACPNIGKIRIQRELECGNARRVIVLRCIRFANILVLHI